MSASWTGSKAPRTRPDDGPDGNASLSVRVRFFAAARDAAGTRELTVADQALGSLLEDLRARYGSEFAAVLTTARVWVNGEDPVDGESTRLASDDEVAILPPVSGGASR